MLSRNIRRAYFQSYRYFDINFFFYMRSIFAGYVYTLTYSLYLQCVFFPYFCRFRWCAVSFFFVLFNSKIVKCYHGAYCTHYWSSLHGFSTCFSLLFYFMPAIHWLTEIAMQISISICMQYSAQFIGIFHEHICCLFMVQFPHGDSKNTETQNAQQDILHRP